MAYTVNKTDSTAIPSSYTVQDNIVNSQTDLSLIGRGYAGYGETIAENFLHLLENFSNSSAPTSPITGQLWYDSSESRLKVYSGSAFKPAGGARYQSNAPAGQVQGDLWIDADTSQLYFFNGTSNVLVGPTSTTGNKNGLFFETIADSTDADQNITEVFNDDTRIAIISDSAFTPKTSISGFATISKGINLSTTVSDNKFTGTATDSDKLGGIAAANYLRSNENDTMTGTLGITNDSGLTIGADNDLKLLVDADGAIIQNIVSNSDISFKVNDGGTTTTVMTLDGATSRIGIGTTAPSTKLEINGTTKSTTFLGDLTGNVTATTGTSTFNAVTLNSDITTQGIKPKTDGVYNIGTASFGYNTVYARATSAQYADLAEIYTSDNQYDPGTVVIFGGQKEVTISNFANDTGVAGVVSTDPAYLMNSTSQGVAVALVGKVPCKVEGFIEKGDLLTTSGNSAGHAKKAIEPKLGSIIGKALEDHKSADQGVIFVSVGKH